MKRLYCAAVFTFLATCVHAQTDSQIRSLLKARHATQFFRYVARSEAKQEQFPHLYLIQRREVAPGYEEAVVSFNAGFVKDADSIHATDYGYNIHLLVAGSRIIYYAIRRTDHAQMPDSTAGPNYFSDRKVVDKLKATFKSTFTRALDTTRLFYSDDWDSDEDLTYGNWCGPSSTPPEMRDSMEAVILRKDRKTAFSWITNTNSEIQLYGVEAYYRMRYKWLANATEQRIISYITHKKGGVQTCYGCTYDQLSIVKACRKFRFGWLRYRHP